MEMRLHWSAFGVGVTVICTGLTFLLTDHQAIAVSLIILGVGISVSSLLRGSAEAAPMVTLEAARTPNPQDRSNPAIAVMIHNLTDVPAEKVAADISFPGTKYVAQIRCDSP